MTEFLLKLLNVKVEGAKRVTGSELTFHGVHAGWIIVAGLILAALVVWMYRRAADHVSPAKRYLLAALRVVFLVLILGLLLRPVLSFTVEGSIRRSLVLLFDVTRSMKNPDELRQGDDLKRAALVKGAMDPTKGLDQQIDSARSAGLDHAQRLELVKAALKNEKLDLLNKLAKEYDLSVYAFGRTFRELYQSPAGSAEAGAAPLNYRGLKWIDALDAGELAGGEKGVGDDVTALGHNVQRVIELKRGQPLAGMFVATDGASNYGSQPAAIAKQAGREGVPLFLWGVGTTTARNITIADRDIFARSVAFAEDDVPVDVTIHATGLADKSGDNRVQATVKLQMIKKDGTVEQTAEQQITLMDGEQAVTLQLTPKKLAAGQKREEYTLRAGIEPLGDEVNRADNYGTRQLVVVDGKIQVLLVEQQPRWEFKYLAAMLGRKGEKRFDLKMFLIEGDKTLTKYEGSPYLDQFPKDEELFKFDVVIFGDVDPKLLSQAQIDLLERYVSEVGGAIVFLAGKRYNPSAYRGTKFEKMLPVELEPASAEAAGGTGVFDKPIAMKLTPEGRNSDMLKLSDKPAENAAFWAKLPPVYWVYKVARAKDGAEVLITDPSEGRKWRNKEMPLLAIQQYNVGQVLYMGTDNTWRWRKNASDKYYAHLWGQICYHMAQPHLMGGSKTTQLKSSQEQYTTGEQVIITARLYNKNYQPLAEPEAKGFYRLADDERSQREFKLTAVPNRPGMYEGRFIAGTTGKYQYGITEREKESLQSFTVVEPKNEAGETAMNLALLTTMATDSRGKVLREEDLFKLSDMIGKGTETVRSTREVELGSTWIYLALLLTVVTIEWVIRKTVQLK